MDKNFTTITQRRKNIKQSYDSRNLQYLEKELKNLFLDYDYECFEKIKNKNISSSYLGKY